MKRLIDILLPQEENCKKDISRIDALIHSEMFLKGFGESAHLLQKPQDYPIVDNYLKAAEMLLSESIYDLPKPWPYQCFMEVWEEEDGRIKYDSSLSNENRIKLRDYIEDKKKQYGDFNGDLFKLIKNQYDRHEIKDFLLNQITPINDIEVGISDNPEHVICNNFPNEIEGFINGLINTSFYIGLKESPFYIRILEAFETGGLPAGWKGPTPVNGGKPIDCLQLLHYGS